MKKELQDKLKDAGVNENLLQEVVAAYGKAVTAEKEKLTQVQKEMQAVQDAVHEMQENEKIIKQAHEQELKAQKDEHEAKYTSLKRDIAIDTALYQAGAKNVKAARALISDESLQMDAGEVRGLQQEIEGLKQRESYLFSGEARPAFLVSSGAQHEGAVSLSPETFAKMGYEQRMEVFTTSPELYHQLAST